MSAALLALDHLHRLNWFFFFSISYFITHLSISLIHESVQTAIHNLNKRYLQTVTHSHQRERDCGRNVFSLVIHTPEAVYARNSRNR